MVHNENIKFCLENGLPIGILEKIPVEDGNYQYEPLRGIGHYAMSTQVRTGSTVKCYANVEERVIKFLIKDIPEYGVIQVEMN